MMTPELQTLFATPVWRLLTALAIGALIGIERERRKRDGASRGAAGLRTFALIGLLGGLAAESKSVELVLVGGAFVGAAALAAYWFGDRRDPGLTTEVAMVATFLLGAEVQRDLTAALAIGVMVTVLLAWREPLHRLVRDVLTENELRNGLIFAIAALVILPLLPDKTVDPFGLINPFAMWRLVVVLIGLSGAGYAASRLLGPKIGLVAAGFASGFVSSSTAIAAMGARSRSQDSIAVPSAAAAAASTLGALIYLTALVAVTDTSLLGPIAIPLGCAFAGMLAYVAGLSMRAFPKGPLALTSGSAFDVKTLAAFVFLMAVFGGVTNVLATFFGASGIEAGAAISGLIDVHAVGAAIGTLSANGKTDLATADMAILFALTTNMLVKIPLSFATGTRGFATRVSAGLLILLAGLWSGYLFRSALVL
ncbi:MAG TPA: DUF4010 domain-containing protein [Rhizomicrobium sp.]|nr:DUF4010 domain-containing protein [Rhizomicrobium sp.]